MKMKRFLLLAALLAIFQVTTNVFGADWKFYGGAQLNKGESVRVFYDNESLVRLPSGNVRIWTKAVTKAEFKRIMKKEKKQIIDQSEKKVTSYYVPPYALLSPKQLTLENTVDIITLEEVADSPYTNPRMKMLTEINCKEEKVRTLSIDVFDANGDLSGSDDRTGEWNYISPESNFETLYKILCR